MEQSRGALVPALRWGEPSLDGTMTDDRFSLPVGTVTFLLTDIEGSSRMWEQDPEAAAKAVGRHYAILDDAIGLAGGEEEFPPLRSLELIPNNLPVQLSTFIGRGEDLAAVGELLSSNRLVTITGAGGAGKTRLALQTAAEVLDGYADGVWWVELA